jgi:hypothetical protein
MELLTELTCEKVRFKESIIFTWKLDSISEINIVLFETWFFSSNLSNIRFLKWLFNPGVFSKISENVLLK